MKKTVRTFALASFLNDFGADMIYPIWPLFLTGTLGLSMAQVGLIDGLGDAMVSIAPALSGYYSDRLRRRKPFIWLGYFLGGLARLGYFISSAFPSLLFFRMLDRSGKMRDAPRDAIIADESTAADRGGNFGILRTFDNLGAVGGIVAVLVLLPVLSIRSVFLIAAVPSFVAALLVIFAIREKHNGITLFSGFCFTGVAPALKRFFAASVLFSLGTFSYSFLLLYARDFGIPLLQVPLFYLLFTLVASLGSYPFGWLSDKIGRRAVVAMSFLLWAMTAGIFLSRPGLFGIILAFVCYGLHSAAFETVPRAYVAELSPRDRRASCLGAFKLGTGLAALPASLAAGLLWQYAGFAAPLYFSLGTTFLALLVLLPFFFFKKTSSSVQN